MSLNELRARAEADFAQRFGDAPTLAAYAPGRVNLIGEHTDYNDGFVLPCAIDRGTLVLARPRADDQLRFVALDFDGEEDVLAPADMGKGSGWNAYTRGMASFLRRGAQRAGGADLVIAGDLPRGGGLSSSASLELAVGTLLAEYWQVETDPTELARLGQRTEHEFAGCQCGIMDQLVSARGVAGSALLIDCRSLHARPVRMPADTAILIIESGVTRGLVDSHYNDRRRQCEAAARHYGVPALRDLDTAGLLAGRGGLDDVSFRRARHVVTENQRTLDAAAALEADDLVAMGRLMDASHNSLRDDFEVTVPAVDELVAIAQAAIGEEGGARMTGGGFGGCVVALLPRVRADEVRDTIEREYRDPDGRPPVILDATPSAGARLL